MKAAPALALYVLEKPFRALVAANDLSRYADTLSNRRLHAAQYGFGVPSEGGIWIVLPAEATTVGRRHRAEWCRLE
jgi:hypothetical protein